MDPLADPPPPAFIARPIAALISSRPPFYLRARILLPLAIAWALFVSPPFEPTRDQHAALILKLESDGGPWLTPPVPGATGFLEAQVEITESSGLGWSTATYAPTARFAEPVSRTGAAAARPTFTEIYTLWLARLDAADARAAASSPPGIPAARQREIVARLAARESLNASSPNWDGFEPITTEEGRSLRGLSSAILAVPKILFVAGAILGLLHFCLWYSRISKPGAARGACPWCENLRYGVPEDAPCPNCGELLPPAMLAIAKKCPECRYDRAGLPDDAKCPECGRRPAEILRSTGFAPKP